MGEGGLLAPVLVSLALALLLLVLQPRLQGAHAGGHAGDGLGQVGALAPLVLLAVVHLHGLGEGRVLPAVAAQDVDAALPHGHPRLAVGVQQRRHAGPLVALRAVGLDAQHVEALHGLDAVVAAADGVDAVVQAAHAVPAARRGHGPPLLPHVRPVVVAQQVLAVGADLVVVAPRDVHEVFVDGARVAVGEPAERRRDGQTQRGSSVPRRAGPLGTGPWLFPSALWEERGAGGT